MRRRRDTELVEARARVARAAVAYIQEVECPAPDLLHRARLRDLLAEGVHELERLERAEKKA